MGRDHPRRAEIAAMLAGHSNQAIAAALGVDRTAVRRVRREEGVSWDAPPPPWNTAEEKWAVHVRPVDGGHLEWTGERGTTSDSPVMRFREKSTSPAAIAFRMRTGRDAVGQVRAECGFPHCVAPEHLDDAASRMRVRGQLRAITGMGARPAHCTHGHDQMVHGRYETDGRAYCEECKRLAQSNRKDDDVDRSEDRS